MVYALFTYFINSVYVMIYILRCRINMPKNGVLIAGTELASIDKVSVTECN
jgi:hypothetical protein